MKEKINFDELILCEKYSKSYCESFWKDAMEKVGVFFPDDTKMVNELTRLIDTDPIFSLVSNMKSENLFKFHDFLDEWKKAPEVLHSFLYWGMLGPEPDKPIIRKKFLTRMTSRKFGV